MTHELFARQDLTFIRTSAPSPDFLTFIEHTVLGTPGRMRYQHANRIERARNMTDTRFYELRKSGQMLGSMSINLKPVMLGGQRINGLYVRHFHMTSPMRETRKTSALPRAASGWIKKKLRELFDDPILLFGPEIANDLPTVLYAYVDSTNVQSSNLVASLDFQPISNFRTMLFSRLQPVEPKGFRSLDPREYGHMTNALAEFYANSTLAPSDFKRLLRNYWVIEDGGQIICGASAERIKWQIHEMPGIGGWLFTRVFPHIRPLRGLFDRDKFEFAGTEGLYFTKGSEEHLTTLMEGVCARLDLNMAMLWGDVSDPVWRNLSAHLRPGLLHHIAGTKPAQVFVRDFGLTPEQHSLLLGGHYYISAQDIT